MSKEEQINFDLTQLIIFNQLCVEANERLKSYPTLFRQNLKKCSNDLHNELVKLLPVYDEAYFAAEEFCLITQQQIEYLVPMLKSLRIDEISTLPFLIEAYKKDKGRTENFLSEILNKELK